MSDSTSTSEDAFNKILPAHLDFLAIYSPALGTTEQTERNQIVYYYSAGTKERRRGDGQQDDLATREERDEQLRQVGLAQGIVNFARSFSNDEAADSVETEKHRIVLKELEEGCSISSTATQETSRSSASTEYSSREVSPPTLLLHELLRAHQIFLLHHSPNLKDLLRRVSRTKFCNLLNDFWTPFARNWDVLLHGNPAVDVYRGIKLAAGGELGIGVGEEEWGSGEREVLEGFVQHTDGLVDLTVCRFGEAHVPNSRQPGEDAVLLPHGQHTSSHDWIGNGESPGPTDGLLFSGVGAMSRTSLKTLTAWTQWIYMYGEEAYGVRNNPASARRRPRRKKSLLESLDNPSPSFGEVPDDVEMVTHISDSQLNKISTAEADLHHGIPPPLIRVADEALKNATTGVDAAKASKPDTGTDQSSKMASAFSDPDIWVKYLTLGYGSSWFGKKQQTDPTNASGAGSITTPDFAHTEELMPQASPAETEKAKKKQTNTPRLANHSSAGRFLIGLMGDLDEERSPQASASDFASGSNHSQWNNRLSLRTLHVELGKGTRSGLGEDEDEGDNQSTLTQASTGSSGSQRDEFKRLRVVVYIRQPFIFTLLFEPTTDSISMPTFFNDLHHHFNPLYKPLLSSTSPTNVASRLRNAFENQSPQIFQNSASHPIFDLIYDPTDLTIHTSIPNIPLPGTLAAEGFGAGSSLNPQAPSWTRIEALNVHSQILNTYSETRRRVGERERTAKTGRGWWIVWMRLPATLIPGSSTGPGSGPSKDLSAQASTSMSYGMQRHNEYREAILIRRAGEQMTPRISIGARFGLSAGRETVSPGPEGVPGWGPARLAQGIGVDARKYVEGLLSLNR